jgi:hypothetical protein
MNMRVGAIVSLSLAGPPRGRTPSLLLLLVPRAPILLLIILLARHLFLLPFRRNKPLLPLPGRRLPFFSLPFIRLFVSTVTRGCGPREILDIFIYLYFILFYTRKGGPREILGQEREGKVCVGGMGQMGRKHVSVNGVIGRDMMGVGEERGGRSTCV